MLLILYKQSVRRNSALLITPNIFFDTLKNILVFNIDDYNIHSYHILT